MTRDAFLQTLRRGLKGLSPQEIDDIIADYDAHFAESGGSGRSEGDVAVALGDPAKIARELRADIGLRRFEDQWSLPNLLAAMMALAGLAFVDIFFLLPLLFVTLFVVIGLAIALAAIGVVGVKIIVTTLLFHFGGPITPAIAQLLIGGGACELLDRWWRFAADGIGHGYTHPWTLRPAAFSPDSAGARLNLT